MFSSDSWKVTEIDENRHKGVSGSEEVGSLFSNPLEEGALQGSVGELRGLE